MYNEIDIKLPKDLIIEENYDDPYDKDIHEKHNYLCYKMFCNEQVLGSARYKLMRGLWYLEEFDAQLPNSKSNQGYGTLFLKFLVNKMLSEMTTKIYMQASYGFGSKSGEYFIQWLTKRGFEQDKELFPHLTSIYSLCPENVSKLFNYSSF